MHKAWSVKSRVRGDFHARFCERVRVKLPRSTRPMNLRIRDIGKRLGMQEIQAFPPQAHCQGFHLAARDSEQRPQSILSLAERSDTKIMSMYRELSVKSRVRGDFQARFCERVRVKLPRSTRPCTILCHCHKIF